PLLVSGLRPTALAGENVVEFRAGYRPVEVCPLGQTHTAPERSQFGQDPHELCLPVEALPLMLGANRGGVGIARGGVADDGVDGPGSFEDRASQLGQSGHPLALGSTIANSSEEIALENGLGG